MARDDMAKGLVISGDGGSQQIAALKAQVFLSDTCSFWSNLTFANCIPLFSVAFRALLAGYVGWLRGLVAYAMGASGQGP